MSARAINYANEAFSFIEGLDHLTSADQVIDAMSRALALFGFENFIITGLPNPQQKFESVVLLRHWPMGWFDVYAQEDYVRVDPIIRLCRRTVHPFEWREAPYDPAREPRAHEVMNRATDFRMRTGFCLPVHGINGYEACLSMSGVDLDLSPKTKPAIHLMAMYAFERARRLLIPDVPQRPETLSVREREALTWAAAGKSAAETAQILGITERTVTAHIVNACQKLDAMNKTQAVAKAIRGKLIQV